MVSVLFPTGKSLLIVGYEINFNVYGRLLTEKYYSSDETTSLSTFVVSFVRRRGAKIYR